MIRPGSANHRWPVLNLALKRKRKKILTGGTGGERCRRGREMKERERKILLKAYTPCYTPKNNKIYIPERNP